METLPDLPPDEVELIRRNLALCAPLAAPIAKRPAAPVAQRASLPRRLATAAALAAVLVPVAASTSSCTTCRLEKRYYYDRNFPGIPFPYYERVCFTTGERWY